jgi:hypothetical protein
MRTGPPGSRRAGFFFAVPTGGASGPLLVPPREGSVPILAAMTDNSRAALLMMAGQAAFVVNDACMKALSDELPLFQAI